jgi:DNA segregation ATPase FtsK/SpoIIIE-like protein
VVVFADPEQRPAVQAMLRAMVCQLCVWHGPDVVQVAIITEDAEAWEWAKWLPHVRDRVLVDASGPARLIFSDVSDFMAAFAENLLQRPAWSPRMDGGVTRRTGWSWWWICRAPTSPRSWGPQGIWGCRYWRPPAMR